MKKEDVLKVARYRSCNSFYNKLRKMLKTKTPYKVYRALDADDIEEIIHAIFSSGNGKHSSMCKRLNEIDKNQCDTRPYTKRKIAAEIRRTYPYFQVERRLKKLLKDINEEDI